MSYLATYIKGSEAEKKNFQLSGNFFNIMDLPKHSTKFLPSWMTEMVKLPSLATANLTAYNLYRVDIEQIPNGIILPLQTIDLLSAGYTVSTQTYNSNHLRYYSIMQDISALSLTDGTYYMEFFDSANNVTVLTDLFEICAENDDYFGAFNIGFSNGFLI